MLVPIFSGMIVSVDAFFIGASLGLQEKCKFIQLVIINAILFLLCMIGFFFAGWLFEFIFFDTDLIVGYTFIALGLWCIFGSQKTTLVGVAMSVEAMFITMGITFIFLPSSTIAIPLTVALAHFGYSAISFFLARTRFVKKIPMRFSNAISGIALIFYGVMALI
jgi:putative Mn2+ efflux pump MntP